MGSQSIKGPLLDTEISILNNIIMIDVMIMRINRKFYIESRTS